MGRPIKKKYFGNKNFPYDNYNVGGTSGLGGEGVATIAIATTGTLYTTSTTLNLLFTDPQIAGGVKPTGRVTTDGTGKTTIVTLLTAGSGYTSTPTATVSGSNGTGTTATFTLSLTTTVTNAIAFTSFLLAKDGGTQALTGGDINKQEASRRYLINNAEGRGQVKLVTVEPLVAGTMFIVATDENGSSYYVKKLTAHKATLVRKTMVGSYKYVTNQTAGWTLGSASTGTVSIASN